MNDLATAIMVAVLAHDDQVDKAGEPYILHPLRVMFACPADDKEQRIVAVLHDVIEDAGVATDELREVGFSDDIIDALEHLTRDDDEPYAAYIDRVGTNRLATAVKFLDLSDNLDPDRLMRLDAKTRTSLRKRYVAATAQLVKLARPVHVPSVEETRE